MGNLTTTDYVEVALAAGLIYFGMKKAGIEKYALLGIGAYFLYGVYQTYSGSAVPVAA